jgi:hypothetical protein
MSVPGVGGHYDCRMRFAEESMKLTTIGTVILTTLIVFGCGRQKPGTEVQGGKEEVSSKDREIVQAIQHAYGLEKAMWKREKSIKSKDDVVNIFREGFCGEKAQELADYYLTSISPR